MVDDRFYKNLKKPKRAPALMLFENSEALLLSLSDEEAGQIIRAAIKYRLTREHPDGEEYPFDNSIMNMAYSSICWATEQNEARYAKICEKNAEAARRKWEKEQKKKAAEAED